ncbi:MAG: CaiB/BaiF CoA-transferase family protein, partial [Anaerolineales bacterium]
PRGLQVIHRLLDSSDILIENYAPGTMERLGLGWDALEPRYPRLIYCALKGFLPGPYEHRAALDEVVQMMSGLAYMTGPVGQPLRAGASIIDVTTGMMGAMSILVALRERDQTGRGQRVRAALFETAAFIMGHHMAYAAVSGEPVPPMPARVSAWAIYHQFETRDGARVFIGVTSDKQWARFCEVFERPDWLSDPRLATNNGRIEQREWFLPAVRDLIATLPLADVLSRCEAAGLPFSPIARPEDLFNDPQLRGSDSLIPTTLPDGRETVLPALPFRLGDSAWAERAALPSLGADTGAILSALGYPPAEINALKTDGVIV